MKQAISWSPAPKLKTPFQIFIPQEAADLLEKEYAKYLRNPWLFSSSRAGAMHRPHSGGILHQRILKGGSRTRQRKP